MITILPDDLEGMYLRLCSPRDAKDRLSFMEQIIRDEKEVKIKERLTPRTIDFKGFDAGDLLLPSPLSRGKVCLYSDGRTYHGSLELWCVDISALTGPLRENFQKYCTRAIDHIARSDGYRSGAGVLLLQGGEAMFQLGKDPRGCLALSFGKGGTARRKLLGLEQFEHEINVFAQKASEVVNAGYEKEQQNITLKFYI